MKSPFMIYEDFESILVPENNEKQNSEESFTNMFLVVLVINLYVLMKNLVNIFLR